MEANLKGLVLDTSKCGGLPLEEKRELVREIAQWSKDAPEILSSFSRKELLEIICAEMGKQRKYSGYTKLRMIEHLLEIISNNSKRKNPDDDLELSLAKSQIGIKKQRKIERPIQLPINQVCVQGALNEVEAKTLLCPNLACRATLRQDDGFCKRCSCCVCHHYDDNKDPSLWLTCDSDVPNEGGDSCGMSCHIKCALKHERSGIMKNCKRGKLDGRFHCVSCGKVNDLMSTWRKQLLVAKEARRVDVLCMRISLCHKILDGTEQYKNLHKYVDTAAKKLKKELGPLDRVHENLGRGIVNRLACGTEVQKLCASALGAFVALSSQPCAYTMNQKMSPTCQIRFEESFPTSVVVVLDYEDQIYDEFLGCRIWHRMSASKAYPEKPSCIVLRPEKKFKISDLQPCTEYVCKVSLFSCTIVYGIWEAKWVTPPSLEMCALISDEQDSIIDESPKKFFPVLSDCDKRATVDHTAKLRSLNDINANHIVSSELFPITPSKADTRLDLIAPGNKRQDLGVPGNEKHEELNSNYEFCVRVVKGLECNGHLSIDFRVKFLTWFSLKATEQERRVVNAFVDTMLDDPPSLAGQLIDAFADEICSERTTSAARILF